MSSAPNSRKMPYQLSAEEIKIHISPIVGAELDTPVSRKWIKRWILITSELITYDGIGSYVVNGLRPPFDAQVSIRRALPDRGDSIMPKFFGDFKIRDTVFMVTAVPPGQPPSSSKSLPEVVSALLDMDGYFREKVNDGSFPANISRCDMEFAGLAAVEKRLPEFADRVSALLDSFSALPFDRLGEYPSGTIHGDPGIDNCFVSGEQIIFSDGPNEIGPELVDVAYFLQSAAASFDDFDIEPILQTLASRYQRGVEAMREDLFLADIIAHASVIRFFDSISSELAPDFAEVYDHLIGERIEGLIKLVTNQTIWV